jgi:predicted alpha/beta superfamily hydrolase
MFRPHHLLSIILSLFYLPATAYQVDSGTLEVQKDFESNYIDAREVHVWLPDGYKESREPFSVLYMHDGAMLFDASRTWNGQSWDVDDTAGRMLHEGKLKNFIVVGIFNGDSVKPGLRHSELFPQKPFEALPETTQKQLYTLQRGENHPLFPEKVKSDNYLKFIVKELKPWVDRKYRVKRDRDHTFIMGSSMGGLISMYAISEYPEVFGGAACLSTHWPGIFPEGENPVPAQFFEYMKNSLPDPKTHRIYFDFGTETLDAHYPPLQAEVDKIMRQKGFSKENWISLRFDGEDHSENAWKKRLDIPLAFLLGK